MAIRGIVGAMKGKTLILKPRHPLQWIADQLEEHPTFAQKKMFGCEAIYLHGRQVLLLAASDEPWNGMLVCTSREHHEPLIADFPHLQSHSVLGKWLYISQSHSAFEETALDVGAQALKGDRRLGIEPGTRKKSRK